MTTKTPLRHRKVFTPEEDALLVAKYGEISLKRLAGLLKRTPHGVQRRAERLGLGSAAENAGAVTPHQLAKNFNVHESTIRRIINSDPTFPLNTTRLTFHPNRGKKRGTPHRYVNIEAFWRWYEANITRLDITKYEAGTMLPEPEWLTPTITRFEADTKPQFNTGPWSAEEVKKLRRLIGEGLSAPEISKHINRSTNAIYAKIARGIS